MKRPDLEIEVKLLNEDEGGRKTPIFNGYRGQFYYNESDWDANYQIIGKDKAMPGEVVKLQMQTSSRDIHFGKFEIGTPIKIREGIRTVADGIVSKVVNQKFELWDLNIFQESTAKQLKPYFGDNILGFKIDIDHYLSNENLFESMAIYESIDVRQILTIKLKKKEMKFAPIYQFISKQWNEHLTLGADRIRFDYKLVDDTNIIEWMKFQFATWSTIYMTGQIIVE